MNFVLLFAPILFSTLFESTIDRAFVLFQNNEWRGAASALDEAFAQDPALFDANNLHYLRGRIAENQRDWMRARDEFNKVGQDNPLFALATFHSAAVSVQLRDDLAAETSLSVLPVDFPSALKMQIARQSSDALAVKIYQSMSSREARFERARLLGDSPGLWQLLRERKDDDIALASARILAPSAGTFRDQMDSADVYALHREFDDALPLYQRISADPDLAAEARYQIARIEFRRGNYALAIERYQSIANDFPGTDWQKDSENQIAASYWRLGDYRNAESSYAAYIRTYGATKIDQNIVQNLIDVYRALGETQKALHLADQALARRLSAADRQVMLFTKAKILYAQGRYTASLPIFQQLGRERLRPAPGATTADEVEFFQGLCFSKIGNAARAKAIWQKLAGNPLSYYGQRAAEKLGGNGANGRKGATLCVAGEAAGSKTIEASLESRRRSIRPTADPAADTLSELLFLRLWDEAALWIERPGYKTDSRLAAEITYMAGRYDRSIAYAGRLPKSETSTLALLYPTGFHQIVCDAADTYHVDPLWLHAIIWQESRYNPTAHSGAAARGLMQFIPDTAKTVGAEIGMANLSPDQLYDPAVSVKMGARLWSSLLNQQQYPEMALAAYNGGPENVDRWKSKSSQDRNDPELFVADIGFLETKRYVMAVFAAHAAYESLGGR